MGLLTYAERKEFSMQTHTEDGEYFLSANEINTDPENKQINSSPGRTEDDKSSDSILSSENEVYSDKGVAGLQLRRLLFHFRSSNDRSFCLLLSVEVLKASAEVITSSSVSHLLRRQKVFISRGRPVTYESIACWME